MLLIGDSMNYYNEIKQQILNNAITKKVKDYSKNRSDLQTYYNVGKLLSDAGKHYGECIIKEYSKRLTEEFGKKYTVSMLYKIKQFYNIYEKVPTTSGKLSWSHWYEMLSIKDINKIIYYVHQCEINNLDVRSLRTKIKNNEYERLPDDTKNKLITKQESKIEDLIKNPIIIKNNNYNVVSEKVLQQLILEDIPSFLEELGSGFAFIKNEYKIILGDRYNYIDLLLFNYKYNCFVVIELKVTELKKEHIGQIEVYMNYIDKKVKTINQDKTIGIIICKKDNQFVMEYCSDDRIIAKTYELV